MPSTRCFKIRLQPLLEGLRGRRAGDTGPHQFDQYNAGLLIDLSKKDVAVVGLHCRTDDLHDLGYTIVQTGAVVHRIKLGFGNW